MDDFSIAEQKLVETLERFDNAASQVLFLIEKSAHDETTQEE